MVEHVCPTMICIGCVMKHYFLFPLIFSTTILAQHNEQPKSATVTKRIHIIPSKHFDNQGMDPGPQSEMVTQSHRSSSSINLPQQCTKEIPSKTTAGRNEYAAVASLPLRGDIAITGKQVLFGTNLYIDKLKHEIDTHSLPLLAFHFLDNGISAARAKTDLVQLAEHSPALLNLFGTKIIVALQKQLFTGNWASFFPLEGLDELRKPSATNSIFLRASYHEELEALIDYTINTLNYRKIAFFYEASDFGDAILVQGKKILNTHNLSPVALGAYPENTVNIAHAVTSIIAGAPNAVICAAGARPMYNFISQMINNGMHRCAFLGISPLFPVQKTLKQSRGINIIVSSVVPDPFKSSLPIAEEYREAMKKYLPNKTISPISFEAYINTAVLVDAISRTSSPVTTNTLMTTLESYTSYQFNGLQLSFNPATRSLCHNVWLNDGSDKEWFLAHTKS